MTKIESDSAPQARERPRCTCSRRTEIGITHTVPACTQMRRQAASVATNLARFCTARFGFASESATSWITRLPSSPLGKVGAMAAPPYCVTSSRWWSISVRGIGIVAPQAVIWDG
jgi:hypothetical protein